MARQSERAACECWFLDVGQGTSNVVLLGDRRAIVIDCGPSGSKQTTQLLAQQYIDTIEALIISHNHSDHDHNVSQVLSQYRKAAKRILFLQDRAVTKNDMPKTFGLLRNAKNGDYPSPERLETRAGAAKKLFSHKGVVLSILYPDLMANLDAQIGGRPNQTSAVLRLRCGGRRVVFSADATVEAWEYLAARFPETKPLPCDVMTVPHHGGMISPIPNDEAAWQRRLYTDLIKPEFAIVSVGTINRYGHPNPQTMKILGEAGVKVLCTQMTEKCCGDLEMIRRSRGNLAEPTRSVREENKTHSGKSRHVACFGSVVAELSDGRVTISSLTRFEQDMTTFSKVRGFNPLCRS